MKGSIKALLVSSVALTITACSSTVTIPERDTYAQPKWYAKCVQAGSEGWFWSSEDYVYSCGSGESRYHQAAEEQMYAIALNNFAKRINGQVESSTKISIQDDTKTTSTDIAYLVPLTRVVEHLESEKTTYIHQGKHFTFVKLKMPKNVFDQLLAEHRR